MGNFITNSGSADLGKRIREIISKSEELKFLVGFFYFSGLRELYEGLKDNPNTKLKILVGLNVDKTVFGLVEFAEQYNNFSDEEIVEKFFDSLEKSLNTESFDTEESYEQIKFFLKMFFEGRLIIRKTREPNHSKLYIFKLGENQIKKELFITGSSNLTMAGLTKQNEFNVEIADYGFSEAEEYFDKLWEKSIKINELDDLKVKLTDLLRKRTLIRDISPFEAYCLVIKTYLESFRRKSISNSLIDLMRKKGYIPYKYQLDAVSQALSVIEDYNGVFVADVVGLGKTIIACLIAKHLGKRGIIICPPALVGDDNNRQGWRKYKEDFKLFDWEIRSSGDLEKAFEFVKERDDIEVVIIDEAHRFRNEDTESYHLLKNICRGKIVILLTATPFNNRPADILALLGLFIPTKKSSLTLDDNLRDKFRTFKSEFNKLSFIKKYPKSKDDEKIKRVCSYYASLFGKAPFDIKIVNERTRQISGEIRDILEPVIIRRNRLDLQKNSDYKDEVAKLSKVRDPQEWFYVLTEKQSEFYDEIILNYFGDPDEGGRFKGAIYRPFKYEAGDDDSIENRDKEKNREAVQQRNLYDFMRRLMVKRFESSFGAFEQSIKNFKRITENVLKFIAKTGNGNHLKGEYILDRDLLEKIYDSDIEEIEKYLIEYENQIKRGEYPKKHKRYKIEKFKEKESFIADIISDIGMFKEILGKLNELKLLKDDDPKTACLIKNIKKEHSKIKLNEPKRKIIIFSEYTDTVKYVFEKLNKEFPAQVLEIAGNLPDSKITTINKNFDASYKEQENKYDILLCTDKISEGFNLNRAGMVVNYDIPWNPVRVIQRLGRINRISKKVFDELYIVNFFPTEQGAELVKSREIAQNKMFMIHNILGEDAKIFDIDEEPTPSSLYQAIQKNPDSKDEESFYTKVSNIYFDLKRRYPDIINGLDSFPPRVKVLKKHSQNSMYVFFKKMRLYIVVIEDGKNPFPASLRDILDKIKCGPSEKGFEIDSSFWDKYKEAKEFKDSRGKLIPEQSREKKALNNLKYLLGKGAKEEIKPFRGFLRMLLEDIEEYGTLDDYALRIISNWDMESERKEESCGDLQNLFDKLGKDYLEKEKKSLRKKEKEIIVAIENRKLG